MDLPFIDIRPPLPGTIYYNHFNCSDDAKSLEECNGQFAEEHCYTGGLDFIIQCNLGMFVVYIHIVNKILIYQWHCGCESKMSLVSICMCFCSVYCLI